MIGADKASRLKADYENLLQAVQQAQERERGLMDRAKELNQTVQVRGAWRLCMLPSSLPQLATQPHYAVSFPFSSFVWNLLALVKQILRGPSLIKPSGLHPIRTRIAVFPVIQRKSFLTNLFPPHPNPLPGPRLFITRLNRRKQKGKQILCWRMRLKWGTFGVSCSKSLTSLRW